ncbi:metallophosphoesterase family protein [Paenibacillus elgii]
MAKFFMTDVHGDYKGLISLLKHAEIDFGRDQLVFGGDMINRGKESASVVQAVKSLTDKYPKSVIALIGNHEEMMSDYIRSRDRTWMHHGGRETLKHFEEMFPDETERKKHMEWAYTLPLYFEDDEFIYTHAGLNPHEQLDKQSRDIIWMGEFDFYSVPKEALLALTHGKPVVHGHTPVERIYFDGVRLNCDLGSNTYQVIEERGLGLVNLTEMTYFVYKQTQKKIEKRKIMQF